MLVLKAERQIPLSMLREIEHRGLGERLVEGFGRVLFLEHSEDHDGFSLIRDHERRIREGDRHVPQSAPEEEERQLAFLQKRIVLDAARTELARVAAGLARDASAKQIPTNSLLGGIRNILRVVQDENSAAVALANLRAWLEARKDRVQKQLDGCEIGKDKLWNWLTHLVEPPHDRSRWDALVHATGNATTLTGLAQRYHLVDPSAVQVVLEEHAALLSVHLVDELLAALARRNRRRSP